MDFKSRWFGARSISQNDHEFALELRLERCSRCPVSMAIDFPISEELLPGTFLPRDTKILARRAKSYGYYNGIIMVYIMVL